MSDRVDGYGSWYVFHIILNHLHKVVHFDEQSVATFVYHFLLFQRSPIYYLPLSSFRAGVPAGATRAVEDRCIATYACISGAVGGVWQTASSACACMCAQLSSVMGDGGASVWHGLSGYSQVPVNATDAESGAVSTVAAFASQQQSQHQQGQRGYLPLATVVAPNSTATAAAGTTKGGGTIAAPPAARTSGGSSSSQTDSGVHFV